MKPVVALLLIPLAMPGAEVAVTSPDGTVAIRLSANAGRASYAVTHRGKPVLLDSGLGLTLADSGPFASLTMGHVKRAEHTRDWKPVYGERSVIPENYREAVVDLEESAPPKRRLQIAIRAYNEGAAVRYLIPAQAALPRIDIASEQTEFHLPESTRAWETHGAQQQFENVWVKDIQPDCERPLTIEYPDGRYACLVEAATRDYPRMLFSPMPGRPWTLVSHLAGGAASAAPFASPWRAVIVGDRPGDLLERNYLLLNLNPPSVFADTSWIKSGKVIREVTLSTKGARETVDFARARHLQYIEFDAGWYGSENDDASDATAVNVDPARKQSDPAYVGLSMPDVIRYAHENGIDVLLYVNRRALEKQLPVLAPLYQSWGVSGIKFGFVNVGSQQWTKWLYDSVELAGKHRLMVDIHDEHRPTGLSRTYPNLMTQEGIAGNETMPTADHNTVLPFTRFVAGAADYTICYFNDRIKTTCAPVGAGRGLLQPAAFIYWYDRPANYHGEPEIEFFDHVPTVWDETRVVDGAIGRWVTVARRNGSEWFVGTINNGAPRRVKVPLSFLPAGKFTAHVYANGRGGTKDVALSTQQVDATTVLEVPLVPAGGQAIWVEPVR